MDIFMEGMLHKMNLLLAIAAFNAFVVQGTAPYNHPSNFNGKKTLRQSHSDPTLNRSPARYRRAAVSRRTSSAFSHTSTTCLDKSMPLAVQNRFYGASIDPRKPITYLWEALEPYRIKRPRDGHLLSLENSASYSESRQQKSGEHAMFDKALDHLHAYANLDLCGPPHYANKEFLKPHRSKLLIKKIKNGFYQVTALLESNGHKTHVCCSVVVHSTKDLWKPQMNVASCSNAACYVPEAAVARWWHVTSKRNTLICKHPPIIGNINYHQGPGVAIQCQKLVVQNYYGI